MGAAIEFRHVDVFADMPFAGNGLIVLFGSPSEVPAEALISLTAELRQFELIMADFQPEAGRVLAIRDRGPRYRRAQPADRALLRGGAALAHGPAGG